MAKKIEIVLCVLLSLVLAALIWHEEQLESARTEINKQMSTELRPIFVQFSDLEPELDRLKCGVTQTQTGTATVQFLVTDLSARSGEEILSPLAAYGYPVGLTVSLSAYPGAEGCLTAEQALAVQNVYFCYAYDADEAAVLLGKSADMLTDAEAAQALSAWLTAVDKIAAEQGLTMSGAIRIPSGAYRDSFADVLTQAGITVVIVDYALSGGALTASTQDGLWFAETSWWISNSILASKLASISGAGGEIVVTMGIDTSGGEKLDDWMGQFEGKLAALSVEVTDFAQMAELQAENAALDAELAEDAQAQIAELEIQIETLEAQIKEIQDKYTEQIRSLGK